MRGGGIVSRGRRVRFPAAGEIGEPPQPVPSLGPIVFTLAFDGVERTIDLSDLPCPRLVRPLAAALAAIGGDDGTVRTWSPGFRQLAGHLRAFVVFTAEAAGAGASGLDLAGLTPQLLDGFQAGLSQRYGTGAGPVRVFMSTVVRLLRAAGASDGRALTVEMQARIGYVTTTPCPLGDPLDAYPVPVFEAIKTAALSDVREVARRIDAGRRLAAAGADPRVAGWSRRENVLWHIQAHGPLTPAEFGSGHPVRRHGGNRGLNAGLFLTPHDLVPFLVALTCSTGLEPECAKGLRANCLSSPSRGFATLSYDKKRAHARMAKTTRVRDGSAVTTPGALIRLADRLTGPARQMTGDDALWVGACDDGLRVFFATGHQISTQVAAWMARHRLDQLTDHGGCPVRLDLRRLRKSYKSSLYLRAGGILDDFTTGHTRQVAASRYAAIGAHREIHDQAVEAGLRQALEVALPPPVIATAAGSPLATPRSPPQPLTPAQARAAASPQADVFLASCTGFDASPFARSQGSACPVPVWGCLECPNAVFTQRHLPSLVSFASFLDTRREAMPAPEWDARYGLAYQRLTTGIFPAFTRAQLEQAHAAAASGTGLAALPSRLLENLT